MASAKRHDHDPALRRHQKTFELFAAGDTDGVFQFESGGMRTCCASCGPDRFDDLIALNALYRPGPMAQAWAPPIVESASTAASP